MFHASDHFFLTVASAITAVTAAAANSADGQQRDTDAAQVTLTQHTVQCCTGHTDAAHYAMLHWSH